MSILDSIQKLIKNDSYASSPAIKNYKSLVDTLKTTNKDGAKSDIVLEVLNAGNGGGSNSWVDRFGGGTSSLADMLNPSTYLNAAAGVSHPNDSPVQQAVAGSANETMENATAFLAQGASRAIVIVLGFIFVGVGLVLFKPALVVTGIPTPVKKVLKESG